MFDFEGKPLSSSDFDERIAGPAWLIARALRSGRPRVHAYPGRDVERFIAETDDPDLAAFWRGLLAVTFEVAHEIPRVSAGRDDVYRVE